ncbi:class A beta-lactamase-related serine hydrolase [Actinomadura sp. KC216]|uniref:serine hydrolase domain-containing protein n=1 Tax=Actinomadura sp. KC216 TaxID=2530370 RepID=UPI001049E425|nr:serine hydrolase domain-containing protein [Actinomadura sp. KC216]TDB82910.1 class A beta-lactamase-related serine hydrolase [Actinomadura sp. KC216]
MEQREPAQPSRRSALGLLSTASLAASGVLAAPAPAAADTGASRTGRVPKELLPGGEFDEFLARRAEQDQFSGTVLLAYRGDPVLTRSYGMADASRSIRNGRDTVFGLASLTKIFTALAVGQLVEEDKLKLHETLGAYLDGFSEAAKQVTVHQLLTHTAGMGHYPNSPDFDDGIRKWASATEMMDGVMAIIRGMEQQPDPVPGTRHRYSNSGYFILGALVAAVSGQSYHDYVRRHVLAAAGMKRSDLYTRPQILADRGIAHPYYTQKSGERADFTTNENFGYVGGPSEGVYASAPDLLTFVRALGKGKVLGDEFTELFTSGKVVLAPTDPPVTVGQCRLYGYGFRNTFLGGRRVLGHSGSGPGRSTNLDIFPGLDWVAVILSNYDTPVGPIVDKERELITRLASR